MIEFFWEIQSPEKVIDPSPGRLRPPYLHQITSISGIGFTSSFGGGGGVTLALGRGGIGPNVSVPPPPKSKTPKKQSLFFSIGQIWHRHINVQLNEIAMQPAPEPRLSPQLAVCILVADRGQLAAFVAPRTDGQAYPIPAGDLPAPISAVSA